MQLVLLAAGLGRRLAPLSQYRPKPLLNFQQRSLISYHLEKAQHAGFSQVLINNAHGRIMHDHIKALKPNIAYKIIDEPYNKPYNTGYGVTHMLPFITSPWISIISADIHCSWSYDDLCKQQPAVAHLILTPSIYADFGLENGRLIAQGTLSYSNIGVFHSNCFKTLKPGDGLGQLIRHHLSEITAEVKTGAWLNVGDFQSYCLENN